MTRLYRLLKKIMRMNKINIIKTYFYHYPIYYSYYKKLAIRKNSVLLESTHGRNISGHLFYLMKELAAEFPQLDIYVAARNVKATQEFLATKGIQGVKVVTFLSREYLQVLASAEYLLNDTTFYPFFTKKRGQKYINIWHGTPLKTLGKDIGAITDIGNVQRNFYMTDLLMASNVYTQEILANAFHLNGVYQGKMVVAPSPRNAILCDDKQREKIRNDLGIQQQKVSFYMPTWRGDAQGVIHNNEKVLSDLRYISRNLKGNERFFVKLHPFQQNIDLSEFENIHPMPAEYELYEFLTAVDNLITDYSSIMYDFLLADRKIILYTYDKEEYFCTRGIYENLDNYPFQQVDTVEALVREIQDPITSIEYAEMKEKFCPYDYVDGVSVICNYIFQQQQHETIQETSLYNDKETVVILGGGFWDNGVTTALLNLFDNVDLTKRNYMVLFGQNKLKKEYMFRVKNLSKEISYYPILETVNAGIIDRILYLGYMRFEWFQSSWINKRVAEVVKDDFYRLFGDVKVDHFIHYTGFGSRYAELIKHTPNDVNTIMYVHTDMFQEYEAKKNFNRKVIFSTYEAISKIALVHRNLKEGLVSNFPAIEDKLFVANNFLGEKRIRQLADEDLYGTLLTTEVEYASEIEGSKVIGELGTGKSRLVNDLANPETVCFINIGRYDYQKGHDRLLAAFERVYREHANTRLIIVAPHGPLREQTLEIAKNSAAKEGIYILGRMSNPYPLLKYCDAFVLSSHYEGLGLVVYEALAVGTAVVTVNLTETTQYLQNNEAIVVENSEDGLYRGMSQYVATGDIYHAFDFSMLRKQALDEFEVLLK